MLGKSVIRGIMGMLAGLALAQPGVAQVKYELYNEQGATAPCIGIGIGILYAKKCSSAFQKQGFVPEGMVGESGLTLGMDGPQDGIVIAVTPTSAAAQAGMAVGDVIVSVDGHAAMPTPGEDLARSSFGPRGQELHLKIRRNGTEQDISFARVLVQGPPAPKGEGFLSSERPLINWRGQIAPCLGLQPSAILAFTFCDKHFAPFGFIRLSDLGGPGFTVDTANGIVTGVDPDSPAAKAGLKVGDEVVGVEGHRLTGSAGKNAEMLLFGKAGQAHELIFTRGGKETKVVLTLGAKVKT